MNRFEKRIAAFESAFNDATNVETIEARFDASEAGTSMGRDGMPLDPDAFVKAAEQYARRVIKSSLDLTLCTVDLDLKIGMVHVQFRETAKLSPNEKAAIQKWTASFDKRRQQQGAEGENDLR